MKRLLPLSLLLTVFLAGCGPSERELELEAHVQQLIEAEEKKLKEEQENFDLNCSVFVVTKGGENQKLGLTPIAALPKAEFYMLRNARNEAASNFHKSHIGRYQELAETHKELKELNDSFNALYSSRKSTYQSLIDSYDNGGSRYNSKVSIYDVLKQVSSSRDHAAARSAHTAINNEVIKLNAIAEGQEQLIATQKLIRDEMLEVYEEARALRFNYFRGLAEACVSTAQIKTKTNADGECKINLHRGKDFMIVAYSGRSVGDSSEEYNWFIPYTAPVVKAEDGLLISNDTLSDSTSPETADLEVFKFPDYVSALRKIKPYELDLNDYEF